MRRGVELRLIKEINLKLVGLPPKTGKFIEGFLKPKTIKLRYTAGEITQ